MELTEREKKYFKEIINMDASERAIPIILEQILILLYDLSDYNLDLSIGLDCIKRLFVEVLQTRGIEIDENLSFDEDETLKEIFKESKRDDFNIDDCKDPTKISNYLKNKIKNLSGKDAKDEIVNFLNLLDVFRKFMQRYIVEMNKDIHDLFSEVCKFNKVNKDENVNDSEFDDNITLDTMDFDDDIDWCIEPDKIIDEPTIDDTIGVDELFGVSKIEKKEITNNEIISYIKFINFVPKLIKYRKNSINVCDEYIKFANQMILRDYYSDPLFAEQFKTIMEHDKMKNRYLFHGTQCVEDAESILRQGLGMMKSNLSSTTYPEFTMDELLLYHRGFCGEIGRYAVVIIDNPLISPSEPIDIVSKINEDQEINFCPSGLQSFGNAQYVVDSKYIIGFVNKEKSKIIFNPNYYNYEKFVKLGIVEGNRVKK